MTNPTQQAAPPRRPSLKELVSETSVGGKYFAFKNIGDMVEGKVLAATVLQARDAVTKEPAFWSSGDPKWNVVISLQTNLRDPQDPEDDGTRSVWIKWWGAQRMALTQALNQAGVDEVVPGGFFRAAYVGEGPAQKGMSAPKLFEFLHTKPTGLAALAKAPDPNITAMPHGGLPAPAQSAPAYPPQYTTGGYAQPAAPAGVTPPVPQGYNTPGVFPTPPAQYSQPAPPPPPAAPAAPTSSADLAAQFSAIRQGLASGMTPSQIMLMVPGVDMATVEAIANAPAQ